MIIESLYPEVGCLYGDLGNLAYLRRCLPQARVISTRLNEEPAFVRQTVDLIYLGAMSPSGQAVVLDRLRAHRDRLRQLLADDQTVVLLTGDALELVGGFIQHPDGSRLDALGLFDFHAVWQTPSRHNSLILADFGVSRIVGYTSRFSHSYPTGDFGHLFTVAKGIGLNPDTKLEGIRAGKLYATYLHGPLLVANPDFTKHILGEVGVSSPRLPFETEVYRAYRRKLAEYEQPSLRLA